MNISENLKRLRKAKKLSQAEMSEMLGFKSHNAYSHWEVGKTSPNVRDLEKLSEVLGASVYEILFGEKMPTATNERSPKMEELEKELQYLKRENQLLQSFLREKGVDLGKFKAVTFQPKIGARNVKLRDFIFPNRSRFGSQPFAH